jgi:hypothetical protein
VGRRYLFTPEKAKRFLEAVSLGSTVTAAAARAGWKQRTAYRYIERGKGFVEGVEPEDVEDAIKALDEDQRELAAFAVEYEYALQASEASHLAEVISLGKKANDWKAFAWILERRWPERYSRTRKAGIDAEKVRVEIERLTVEVETAQLQLEAMKRGGGTSRLLLPADLVQSMAQDEPELAEQLLGYLARKGVQTIQRADITSGVSAEDMAEVSPSTVH